MTLFKKLAGKASALLNASGICSNNCIDGVPKISDFGDENDLIRRGDALRAIRKACISAYLPFNSATPEGKRVMDALYAVWKVKKRGKEA